MHPPTHSQRGSLAFVHLTHPDDIRDRKVQTEIRRHVMKDIGRSRRQRPRHHVVPLEVVIPGQTGSGEVERRPEPHSGKLTRRREAKASFRVLSSLNFVGSYPVEPDQRALELLHFMRSEMDCKYRPFRIIWLRMAIADPATFNLSLAHGVVFLNELRRRAGYDFMYDNESVKYLTRALKHLSYYLEDETSRVSEATVCTILGLACKDANYSNWAQWFTHMNGLEQIYRLRGGFQGMGYNLPILAVWLDLLGAAFHDIQPRFALPPELDQEALIVDDHSPSQLSTLMERLEEISVEFVPITEAIALMSMVAATVNSNSNQSGFWESDVNAVRIIGPASHHSLSISRLPNGSNLQYESPVAIIVELTRLACLALLAALKLRFSLPATEVAQLCERFCKLLQHDISRYSEDTLELVLWATVTVALVGSDEQRQSTMHSTGALMSQMGLLSGVETISRAKQIIWIDHLHSEGATNLAQEIDNYIHPENILT